MNGFFLGILEITAGMSFLILVMLFVLKLIGGKFTAKCRYILWTLVMIRLAVPFSFGILPALIEVPVEPEPVQMQTPAVEYTPVPQNPVTIPPQEQVQMPDTPVQMPVFTEPEPEPITWDDVKAYIPHAYLTGAAVFLLWNLLSYWIYTAKILRTAREADTGTQQIYEAVCRKKGLSRLPVLLVSPDVNSPAAFGLLRRRIVLPEIDFTENGLAGTLSHEVTHCKRGDLWIKAVCLFARALHWFNPLVHLAAFRCEMEMELSCDESVLTGCDENTRAAYGEVMLDIIKRCRRNRGALTTHFNPKKNAVKARFTNILYGSGKKRGLWLIVVCLVLCLIAGAIVACRTEVPEEADETAEEAQQRETLLATYELYQTDSDLQAQLELLDDKHADLTANRAELQAELQTLTASREDLYTQLAGMPEDSEEALHLRLAIQEYDERIKSHQMAMNGVDVEIALAERQRQTVQEKLQALADSINDTEAKMQEMDILQENDIAAEDTTNAVTVTSPIYLCDDVYRGDITPTHGESTITFPDGLDGYKLYTCEVLLCGDGCDPQDVVYRNYFGYAGGFPLNELALTDTGKYSTRLYKVTYPEEELAQILDNMELQGASEQHKQEYRNKRWYLYLLTVDEDHYACIFLEPEDVLVVPENEQEILDAMVAGAEITMVAAVPSDPTTIWQTFLDTVVSPYSDYVVTHEFLDLDGNGIDELIIYDWGASASCGIEIFTIENGEVRSFSTGTNGITHYSEEAKSLAPPSANANAYSFWGLPTSYADRSDTVLWFVPCDSRKRNGHVLYSMNGSDVHTSEDYYCFTSDENGLLTVELLCSFRCEAIDSNPANGWKCYINGEEVNVRWFRDTMGFFWQDLSVSHGVQYHDKNTASRYEELESWVEDYSEEILQPEEEVPEGIVFVDEDSAPYTYTREEWIQYSLYTDFGFREPVDVSALTDDELTAYMADAYQCALDIWFLFEVCSDRMYARNVWSSDMPHVEIDGRHYSQMFNPIFPTLADLETYMNGVLSHDLTKQLLSMGMFIDYEGELWGMMGARGTDISKKTIGFSVTSRTDTEIIYTAEVEVREHDLSAEEPDYVEYHDFTYSLTEDGWRWTDFHLYN